MTVTVTASPVPTATPTPTRRRPHRPTSASSAAAPGGVIALPAGLLCRDLVAQGFPYSAAAGYWDRHGQPGNMDADKNGVPCETVYPRAGVIAHYVGTPKRGRAGLAPGLRCADLADLGIGYPDGNGIPCETVYADSEVKRYWG